MKIWEEKALARKQEVQELIDQLKNRSDERSVIMSAALEFYGFEPGKMPHKDWVRIRKEVIDKAKSHLAEVSL
jgi:erythromycin esterase-like protein